MNLFDVYPLFPITPVRALGSYIWDDKEKKYLDFYGGHAVISIGHAHKKYTAALNEQLNKIAFYSNAVQMPLQQELAKQLGRVSNYEDFHLFLCNSGTEANENALKLASFHNGRKKIIAFNHSFHGRTSLSLGVTDDPKLSATINTTHDVQFLPLNDIQAFEEAMNETVCAVIIEGIQGVGGINIPNSTFLQTIATQCEQFGALLILDEIQSGYGRTGKFFAHQHSGIQPHLITVAKGMGNGFPVAGVLIHPTIKAKHGMLGTTFGGNYLAVTAALSVLEIIEEEKLIANSESVGTYLLQQLSLLEGIKQIRGQGLMIGIETYADASLIRKMLLSEEQIFTGYSSNQNTIRLLPPLSLSKEEANQFIQSFNKVLKKQLVTP